MIVVFKFLKGFDRSVLSLFWVVLENNISINERKWRRDSFLFRGREFLNGEVKDSFDFCVIFSVFFYCMNYRDYLFKIF